ncbi:acyl-CoA dehydratase activase [Chloroflexota bacterium]
MYVAGIDIGSSSAKSAILEDHRLVSWSVIAVKPDGSTTREVMENSLRAIGLSLADMACIVATGYGRELVPFSHSSVTEISCHARGSQFFYPETRTILDMGGQDCKAIRCDENGKVTNFVINDKCAAGTGRYLEKVAATLELHVADIGALSLKIVDKPVTISSYCAVFAQNDVLLLLREGKHPNDILAGAFEAIAERIEVMLEKVGVAEDFFMSGGVAKNTGVVRRLEKRLGVRAYLAFEPQIVGAIGAALFAQDIARKRE